jgi:hypothetical protein
LTFSQPVDSFATRQGGERLRAAIEHREALALTGERGEGLIKLISPIGPIGHFQQPVEVDVLCHLLCGKSYQLFRLLTFLECETEMATGNSKLGVARQVAKAGNSGILASTTQSCQLALGSDEVEDDACKTEPGIEMAEAIDEGCHAISHRLGTDQQHHRNVKYLSDLCSTATRTIGTVEEPHGSLNDTSIGIAAIMPEQGLHMSRGRHIGVKVH